MGNCMFPCRADYLFIPVGCPPFRATWPYGFRLVVTPSLAGLARYCLQLNGQGFTELEGFAHTRCRMWGLIQSLAVGASALVIAMGEVELVT